MKSTLVKAALIVSAAFYVNCSAPSEKEIVNVPLSEKELIERGKYLTAIGGCHDCHSPKVMTARGPALDSTRLLSGHPANQPLGNIVPTTEWVLFNPSATAYVGPWGVTYSANLTPDDTGIGNWKYEQFETAIRKGKYKGLEQSRPLLPPMPWQMYSQMTDDDLKSIFAYLKSLPPVSNVVPPAQSPDQLQLLSKK